MPEKFEVVLAQFRTEDIKSSRWGELVNEWLALETAAGFEERGPALRAKGRPDAVHWWVHRNRRTKHPFPTLLDSEDAHDLFYLETVKWWLAVNPDWRKVGVETQTEFLRQGLAKNVDGDLDELYSGLNGLTSVVACLLWWYRVEKVSEGSEMWHQMVDDVLWVLTEKLRAQHSKRGASQPDESPSTKRARK
ncbi:hypothetical protein FB45DRAFT_755361 [Roridomyces roridus]|uniref:Uncharacterized protein n=1 Tax=Roridomyces roridus TaxID=1738132 RepID=A0AAD7BFK6_9AGAR|nr:hypothetical protein FB45DRAFT_755361 [Roridomyces roridus]